MSYIESELEALEREQASIDLKAGALEKKLRGVMGGGGGNTDSKLLCFEFHNSCINIG